MIPINAAVGMATITDLKTKMNRRRVIPEIKVESRFRPPDLTLMTAWPIIAQPAWPPKKPVIILANPCALTSRWLSLWLAVILSTMGIVNKDSINPTIAKATELGKIIRNVSKLTGTLGQRIAG